MAVQAITKGWNGELKTRCVQALFLELPHYHVFNDVIIRLGSKSTQIDHIIVSKYGVFVVETKDRSGWIFGSAADEQWTQGIYGNYYKFQNPLRQNYMHTESLAEFLRLDHDKLHSLVVFWGDCEFKTPMPANVLNHEFTPYVKSKKEVLLTNDEVKRVCGELRRVKDTTPYFVYLAHAKSLEEAYESNTTCPKCGGHLVERTSHKTQERFLGCDNYPQCHYTKEFQFDVAWR